MEKYSKQVLESCKVAKSFSTHIHLSGSDKILTIFLRMIDIIDSRVMASKTVKKKPVGSAKSNGT